LKATLLAAFKELHQQKIFTPAASAFSLRILGALLQFFFTLLLARLYGASGIGIFTITLSILVVSSTIVRWGLDQTALKLVAANLHSKHYANIHTVIAYATRFIVITGFAFSAVLMLLSDWFAIIFFGDASMAKVILLMSAAITPLSLTTLFAEALRGLKFITTYTLLHGVLIPFLSIIFIFISRYWLNDIMAGAAAYFSASLIVTLIAILLWHKHSSALIPVVHRKTISSQDIQTTANSLSWISILLIAMTYTETFILGIFQTDKSVGLYATSLRLVLVLNLIITGFNSILAPNFASLYQQKKLSEIQSMARHAILIMLVISLPVLIIYITFPGQILSIFGTEFESASPALIILSFGHLINILSAPMGIIMQMTGQEVTYRNNVLISAGPMFLSALILIPKYGIVGASAASFIGIFTLNSLSHISLYRKLGISLLPDKLLSFLTSKR